MPRVVRSRSTRIERAAHPWSVVLLSLGACRATCIFGRCAYISSRQAWVHMKLYGSKSAICSNMFVANVTSWEQCLCSLFDVAKRLKVLSRFHCRMPSDLIAPQTYINPLLPLCECCSSGTWTRSAQARGYSIVEVANTTTGIVADGCLSACLFYCSRALLFFQSSC